MDKQFYFWMLVLVCNDCFAQLSGNKEAVRQYYIKQSEACGGASELFKKTGSWKKSSYGDDIIFPDKTFPAKQYNVLLGRIEKVLPIMKEALPDLGGFDPVWHGSIRGNSFVPTGPIPASFKSMMFTYYCNTSLNKIILGDETANVAEIYFNSYGFFCEKMDQWDINGYGKMISIYQLPDSIGKWKGLTLYEPKQTAGPGLPIDRAVVLGHNGQMPWHILTQMQYLTGYKNWLLKSMNEQLEGNDTNVKKMKESIASMQASKALTQEQKTSIVGKLEQQLKNFQDNSLQKQIGAAEKIYNDKMKPVNEYLDTATAETLSQKAILATGTEFKGYFAKQGQPGKKLINFTTKYFNTTLHRYVPQFIVLYWRWGLDPSSLKFAKEMGENFPIEKLKALIDK
ncbi:MAG: hypothetical protein H7Y86_01845 [Rhizobacter sp.]|nr:hypothetical protein [Ferruginibacter sp.]